MNFYLIGGLVAVAITASVGSYFVGYSKGIAKGELKIAEFSTEAEKKITNLNKRIEEAEGKIVIQYVDKVKKIKEKEYVYVNASQENVPSQYDLSNGWVYLHDVSAQGSDADTARAADETTSGVRDNQALAVVVTNYSRCRENSEQLKSLQTWMTEAQREVDKSNSENSTKEVSSGGAD